MEKLRVVEGGIFLNRPVCVRENFVADPFLNGEPMKAV